MSIKTKKKLGNAVHGTATLFVSVDVESDKEEMALLEANYKYSEIGLVDCLFYVVDAKGKVLKIHTHDFHMDLDTFIED